MKQEDSAKYFVSAYRDNIWLGKHSRSGGGSEGEFATQKVDILTELIATMQIEHVLDVGCGDFYWMQRLTHQLVSYVGVDIVDDLIAANKQHHSTSTVNFLCADLSKEADRRLWQELGHSPDLLLSLDIFGHLLNDEVDRLLHFILNESGARLWLVTNRRDKKSCDYLQRPKTRLEGIDLEAHRFFKKKHPRKIRQITALYPGDFFDLYDLSGS